MVQEISAKAASYSVALVSALGMLLLGILGNLGVYTGAVEAMQPWHIFFSLSIGGIIAGIVEAMISMFVITYVAVYFYNKFI